MDEVPEHKKEKLSFGEIVLRKANSMEKTSLESERPLCLFGRRERRVCGPQRSAERSLRSSFLKGFASFVSHRPSFRCRFYRSDRRNTSLPPCVCRIARTYVRTFVSSYTLGKHPFCGQSAPHDSRPTGQRVSGTDSLTGTTRTVSCTLPVGSTFGANSSSDTSRIRRPMSFIETRQKSASSVCCRGRGRVCETSRSVTGEVLGYVVS